MPPVTLTRRRAITIFAAAAAAAVTGPARPARADFTWRGVAMGADATILFNGIDQDDARTANRNRRGNGASRDEPCKPLKCGCTHRKTPRLGRGAI